MIFVSELFSFSCNTAIFLLLQLMMAAAAWMIYYIIHGCNMRAIVSSQECSKKIEHLGCSNITDVLTEP